MLGIYELNKIYNEDCYKAIKNIPDASIDLVYIDPPYQFCQGCKGHGDLADRRDKTNKAIYSLDTDITKRKIAGGYTSGGGCFGTKKRNYHSQVNLTDVNIKNDVDENTYFVSKGFSNELLDDLCRVMKKINIYIWCNKEQLRQIIDYFDDKDCFIDLFTWHKTNPIPTCNNTYLPDTEYCIFARESGVKVYGSVETKKKWYISSCNKSDKELFKHPTCKPLDFVKDHIFNSTQENEIVLDAFIGSGTTAVACKELNRNFIGFEINPEYYQIAVDRINGISQVDKRIKETGQTDIFDFLEE